MNKSMVLLLRIGTLVLLATIIAPWLQAQTVADIEADLALLEQRLLHLRDVSEIEKLQRSYGYYADKQQWQEVRDLFTADGVLEPGGRGRFLGKQSIFEFLLTSLGPTGPVPGTLQDQQQVQGIVTVNPDGQSAEGRWSAFVVAGSEWSELTYENDYVKEDGVWKIRFLHAPINMSAPVDTGWASNIVPNTRPESALPPPDLPPSAVYLSFPNYYNEPFHYPNPVTGRPAPPPDPAAGGAAFGKP